MNLWLGREEFTSSYLPIDFLYCSLLIFTGCGSCESQKTTWKRERERKREKKIQKTRSKGISVVFGFVRDNKKKIKKKHITIKSWRINYFFFFHLHPLSRCSVIDKSANVNEVKRQPFCSDYSIGVIISFVFFSFSFRIYFLVIDVRRTFEQRRKDEAIVRRGYTRAQIRKSADIVLKEKEDHELFLLRFFSRGIINIIRMIIIIFANIWTFK